MASSNKTPVDRQMSLYQCVICCHENDFFCVGSCDHPVCFECATRIRVICGSKICPTCRLELNEVWITSSPGIKFGSFANKRAPVFDKTAHSYGIKFENRHALEAFKDILAHVCTVCQNEPEFPVFAPLNQHMRREHQLFYCDLCVQHLNLFSWERKCYTKEDLARHRRIGDEGDKSHRGHPLCEFCDNRFLDNDQLYRHLRTDHFFCHFCDLDAGANHFFDTYDELAEHFRGAHYLCEEGACKEERFTTAFRTEIDLKAHKTNFHSGEMGKNQRKQERVLNVQFNYDNPARGSFPTGPRGRGGRERGRGGRGRGHYEQWREEREKEKTESSEQEQTRMVTYVPTDSRHTTSKVQTVSRVMTAPNLQDAAAAAVIEEPFSMAPQDFPRLGGKAAKSNKYYNPNLPDAYASRRPYAAKTADRLDSQEFPSLPSSASVPKEMNKVQNVEIVEKKKEEKGLVIIDDNEPFPELPKQVEKKRIEPKKVEPKPPPEAEEKANPSLFQSLTSGAWSSRPDTLGQAVACLGGNDNFPSLKSGGKISGLRQAKPKPQTNSAWATVAKTEPPKPKPPSPVLQPKLPPENIVRLDQPFKTKARRVAQRNQRTASESHDAPPPFMIGPPPGFEPEPAVTAPPGFEPIAATTNGAENRSFEYAKPADFEKRNGQLFKKVQTRLGDDRKVSDFKELSGMFRRGDVGPEYYYEQLHSLLGNDCFGRLFPELLCLLPDIKRQQQLVEVHRRKVETRANARNAWNAEKVQEWETCRLCWQIVAARDMRSHAKTHDFDESFPAL